MANYHKGGIEQVENIAQKVIQEDFEKLSNITIGYQFREEARKSKGRVIYASPKKIPGKLQNFVNLDLIITVAEDKWNAADSNTKKKAILDDVFRTIHLEDKEGVEGFPRRVADDRYMLSDGRKIKGKKAAEEAQQKICDYDIKIYDHAIKANGSNFRKYGAWRKDLEQMQKSVQQTNIFSRTAGE
ncbi:putative metallopeptidase [Sporohalobacter salinus]|uniref:putative metallopeptidase n=1 Tax=Sporohalobacter salinus TaxID=1494606 RepID=UPI00195FF757|nr:putative metallopeptidase [Sporohalobacter salinus]MBM7624764.1 hypothetical protein [Sporohalobacter salinus]